MFVSVEGRKNTRGENNYVYSGEKCYNTRRTTIILVIPVCVLMLLLIDKSGSLKKTQHI